MLEILGAVAAESVGKPRVHLLMTCALACAAESFPPAMSAVAVVRSPSPRYAIGSVLERSDQVLAALLAELLVLMAREFGGAMAILCLKTVVRRFQMEAASAWPPDDA